MNFAFKLDPDPKFLAQCVELMELLDNIFKMPDLWPKINIFYILKANMVKNSERVMTI